MTAKAPAGKARPEDPAGSYEASPDRTERILFFLTVGLLSLGGLAYVVASQF
jgi:hypothetical protein